MSSRLDMFDLHLMEARNFLNSNGYLLTNSMQLKIQVDDNLIYSDSMRNEVNLLVDNYNQNIMEYNKKIEIMQEALKLMVALI